MYVYDPRSEVTVTRRARRVLSFLLLICLGWGIESKLSYCFPHESPLGIKAEHAPPPAHIEPILNKLDEHIQNNVRNRVIPGCAVAVVHRNQIVFMKAYGVKTLGTQDKIDTQTVFQLGSVSKPVAATLATILDHQGLIRLDDPVNYYLPGFTLNSKQPPNQLKVRHVLSHSTGVPRAGFNNLIEAHAPYQNILHALQNTRVRTPVGKTYDYHNAMFSIISDITKSASGASFKEVLHTKLLQPLNMSNTTSTLDGLLNTNNRASPHVKGKHGLIPSDTYSKGYYAVAPAGGINSSIKDMAVFLKAQMGGYPHVVSHKMLAKLHTPQVHTKTVLSPAEGPPQLIKNARYALGWRVVDFSQHRLIFHGGWVKGFTNFIGFIPEHDLGIVVLHNGESKFSSRTGVKFFEMFLNVPKQKGLAKTKNATSAKILLRNRGKAAANKNIFVKNRVPTKAKVLPIKALPKKAQKAVQQPKKTALAPVVNKRICKPPVPSQIPKPPKKKVVQVNVGKRP